MAWNMVGHGWAVRHLSEHVAQARVRHAYLLTGPPGVGRRTLALRFFQAINCTSPPFPGQACGACIACSRIERMQHPDLEVVQAEQEGGVLKVDQIRELQRRLSLTPYDARFRMALLLRFEEANQNAANALLKTLEEPSAQVVLILTAESAESLLPTIVSRCEGIRLGTVALDTVQEKLESRWGLPSEQARLLAHLSGGRVGHALQLHRQPEKLEQRQSWLEDLQSLLVSSRVARFAYAESLTKDKDLTRRVLMVWLSYWRDVMLRTAGASALLTNLDWAAAIDDLASRLDLATARCTVSGLERTIELLESNVNVRIAVEVLLLDLPGLERRS